MQHTKLDRWLCRQFVHINRIYFNTLPESLPRELDVVEADKESGSRYRYRATTFSEQVAKDVCDIFATQNITYTARVDERDTLIARFVGNPKRSVTMLFVWLSIAFLAIAIALSGMIPMAVSTLLQDKKAVEMQDKIRRDQRTNSIQ